MRFKFGANEAEDRKRRAERDSGIPIRGMDFTPDPPRKRRKHKRKGKRK